MPGKTRDSVRLALVLGEIRVDKIDHIRSDRSLEDGRKGHCGDDSLSIGLGINVYNWSCNGGLSKMYSSLV